MNDSHAARPRPETGGPVTGGKGLIALGLIVALVLTVLLEPTGILRGRLLGETFFNGHPRTYWEKALGAGPAERSTARQALEGGGQASVPVLTELLRESAGEQVRWTAAEILGNLGPDANDAADALLSALSDRDPYVQSVAAQVIPQVGTPAADAVPALTALLDGEHAPVAARALSVYKAQAAPAIPKLIAVLTDRTRTTDARWNAARTIGKIGPPAVDTVPVLIEMTRDEEPTVRGNAAEAIGDIGPTAIGGIPSLIQVLDDPAFRVRHHAVRSLGYIGPAAREAIPHIKPLLKDPDESVRQAAQQALEAIAPDETASDAKTEHNPAQLGPPE